VQATLKSIARTTLRAITALVVLASPLGLAGCAGLERTPAEPAALGPRAEPDIAGCAGGSTGGEVGPCRFLVERDTTAIVEEARAAVRRELALWSASGHQGPPPTLNMLAISGGGDDGAFGAGLLVGWSEAGTRPDFKVVTGVSTGALAAPFAFLGSGYDDKLQAVYTTVTQKDIFVSRGLLAGLFSDAMSDTTPLYRLVERNVDRPLLDAIAAEYAKGRLLLIGTTNLDTLEPVIWNMTAIAASKDPHALTLFRKILLASSAIPAAFPPVMIDVVANGTHYQEMHVDGGAMAQVFIYPPALNIRQEAAAHGVERNRVAYVIRNARLDPEGTSVERSTLPIATRAVSSLIQTQGIGDLYRIYALAQRDHVDFNLAYIPSTFDVSRKQQFDTIYMQALFKQGHDMAVAGYPWEKFPPGYNGELRLSPR
jgi:predicted acylesterase/phospholipase RssA